METYKYLYLNTSNQCNVLLVKKMSYSKCINEYVLYFGHTISFSSSHGSSLGRQLSSGGEIKVIRDLLRLVGDEYV